MTARHRLPLTRADIARFEKEIEREVEDEKDYDMDDWMAMSDEEHETRIAEVERKSIELFEAQQRALSLLPRIDRYRHERRLALYYLLKWHAMHDRMKAAWPEMDFLHEKNVAIIKRRQAQLLDWRRYLVTGILPHEGAQQ
jgi:hypothetical protein